jgi:hypothetical protein
MTVDGEESAAAHAVKVGSAWMGALCTQGALRCAARRVINSIQTSDIRNLFNPENIWMSKEGGGAGNNWASGYTQGEAVQETLLDMIGECARQALTEKGKRVHPAVSMLHVMGPYEHAGAPLTAIQTEKPSIATAWRASHCATALREVQAQAWAPTC